jgi:hypothetical protein
VRGESAEKDAKKDANSEAKERPFFPFSEKKSAILGGSSPEGICCALDKP